MRPFAALIGVLLLLVPTTVSAGGHGGAGASATLAAASPWKTVLAPPHVISPGGLAIDLRGRPNLQKWAYTADAYNTRIVKFGTGGSLLGSWAYGKPQEAGLAVAVAVDRRGNVLVADPATDRVTRYSPSGAVLASWGGFREPNGVATDRFGNIYVTELGADRVTKLRETGPPALWRIDVHCGTSAYGATPIGLAVDPTSMGYIYVVATCPAAADESPLKEPRDEVIAYNGAGQYQNAWIGESLHGGFSKEQEQWVKVESIAVDRWGNWYVAGLIRPLGAQKTARGVFIYYPHSYARGYWFLPGATGAYGVAVDGMGRVYVTQGRRVLRHAPLR